MKISSFSNFTILILLSLIFASQNVYCQKKGITKDITPTMARKIGWYCQYNDRVFIFFANVTGIDNRRDADVIIRSLDKNLDYAEKFIIGLYATYGIEMSYFTLKNAGFTIQETDQAEFIWKKEQKKWREQEAIEEKKKEKVKLKKEQEILNLALRGHIFESRDLFQSPQIRIDMEDLAHCITFWKNENMIDWTEQIDYSFDFIISKDGKLSLTNSESSKNFSTTKKILYDYIIKKAAVQNSPSIVLKQIDTTIVVSAKTTLRFIQKSTKYRNSIEFKAKKNKKTQFWKIINDNELQQQLFRIDKKNSNIIYLNLENELHHTPYSIAIKKGSYQIKAEIIENEIEYIAEGKKQGSYNLPYSFEIKYKKSANNSIWYVLGGIGILISGVAPLL